MKQTKLIFGKSMNFQQHDKSEYLERRVRYFMAFDIQATHTNIVMMDFGLSVYDFMRDKTKKVTDKVRKYNYKRRGRYGNNKAI